MHLPKVQKDIKAQLGSLTTSMAVVDLNSAVIRSRSQAEIEAKKRELTLGRWLLFGTVISH